jgi:hypothetical protein
LKPVFLTPNTPTTLCLLYSCRKRPSLPLTHGLAYGLSDDHTATSALYSPLDLTDLQATPQARTLKFSPAFTPTCSDTGPRSGFAGSPSGTSKVTPIPAGPTVASTDSLQDGLLPTSGHNDSPPAQTAQYIKHRRNDTQSSIDFFTHNMRGYSEVKMEEYLRCCREKGIFTLLLQESWKVGTIHRSYLVPSMISSACSMVPRGTRPPRTALDLKAD